MSNKINNPITFLKLSQATTVCFDKETALCDGELLIKKVVILDVRKQESEVSQVISNVLNAVNERNPLIDALKKLYDFELSTEVKKVYPYDYETRTMGASFRGGKAYFIGLVDNMSIKNKPGILKRCEEYFKYGQDVYVLAQGENEITENLDVVALIVTKEHVRESMVESIKWLNEQNINVKVISSDTVLKASSIAYDAGVKDTSKQISMDYPSIRNTEKYVVFGDAQRDDKNSILKALKSKGEKVVYIDDDFDNLPKAFEESKRWINNLHRVCLFLITKVLLAVLLAILFGVSAATKTFDNPFALYRYFVIDAIIDVAVILLLIFDRKHNVVQGKFITNALKKSLPGALMMYLATVLIIVLYSLQKNGVVNYGIHNTQIATTMNVMALTVLNIPVFCYICLPLSQYRRGSIIVVGLIATAMLVASAIISYTSNKTDPLFDVPFMEMSGPAYFITALIVVMVIALYFVINKIFRKDEEYEN